MDQRLLRILGAQAELYPHALESKFPRVFGQIMALWDMPEIDDYFMELMVDGRGGRAGFPQDVAAEIMHLSLVHASQHQRQDTENVWDVSAKSFVNFDTHATLEETVAWREPPQNICAEIEHHHVRCTLAGFLQAAENGNRAALGLFLEAHTGTESRNEHGWTALMLAAFTGHVEIIELLLRYRANVYAIDAGGNTALHWAAFAGHVECAKILIAHHAEVDARNSLGLSPLAQATSHRNLEIVMLLINHGANLNLVDQGGNTALHKAATAGYAEIIRPLLAHQADTNVQNLVGDTPLKLASKNNHEKCVSLLLTAQSR